MRNESLGFPDLFVVAYG